MESKEKISFVIPCYRSGDTIAKVVEDIDATVKQRPEYNHEIILINDGSPDDTYSVIKAIGEAKPHVVVVNLMRNFGQASAIMAGYHYVTGDLVINLDDDGQTDPVDLFKLVDRVKEGYDVVYARYMPIKNTLPFEILAPRSMISWRTTSLVSPETSSSPAIFVLFGRSSTRFCATISPIPTSMVW